ncbi:erythromycin esterase family protein [Kribbella sp. NPDC051770]|uniref:erythromycin esterase family protein n=1 Tax=Kribbella sp. NPDC051770 TaxID=3155413 RepID=UPI0034267F1E
MPPPGRCPHPAASALGTTDPAAPLDDLDHLRKPLAGARIVALGEASHDTAELTRLKHRTLRHLVERQGFRAIAWEDDWSLGTQLDSYITTGRGDLRALIAQMSDAWHSSEVEEVFRYLRRYNATHRNKVRFAGVEYFSTRHLAYDAVDAYVARHAPDQLAALRAVLKPIVPHLTDMGAYVHWYWKDVADKAPYIRNARAVLALLTGLRHSGRSYAVVLHHARQIVSFYEAFSLEDNFAYRDARAAENLRWWHRFSGEKVVYWAAAAHTANAPHLQVSDPPVGFASAGSHLRRWYGDRYRTIGFTFDHGTAYGPIEMPPARATWFEHPLGEVPHAHFTLDLHARTSAAARDWLHAPLTTRGFPHVGPASEMSGGTLAEWHDVLIHTQQVTPIHPL